MTRHCAPLVAAFLFTIVRPAFAGDLHADWIKEERITLKTTDLKPADKPDPKIEKVLRDELDDSSGTVKKTIPYQLYWFDLNGDGKPEALVDIETTDYCGSGGCALSIYRLGKTGEYEHFAEILSVFTPFVIASKRKTKGWRDLFILTRAQGELNESGFHHLRFDGKSYPNDAGRGSYIKPGETLHGVKLVDGTELHLTVHEAAPRTR